jgi:HD-like signal output (HDOD) protein
MYTARELIRKYSRGNTFPHIIARLAKLINDDESTLRDFEEIISLDPALTARLLTIVNSSYYGLLHKVDSISRAIAVLGMKNLHYVAVTNALKGMFKTGRGTTSLPVDLLWTHSAAAGICSKMIAERIFSINGDDAYLTGLLHDIGLIVEWQGAKKEFTTVYELLKPDDLTIIELEDKYVGTNHCDIGYMLAEEWGIPDPSREAILEHHTILDSVKPDSPTGILQISEYIISQLDFTVKEGVHHPLSPPLLNHVKEYMEEYMVLADELPEELDRVRELFDS